MPAHTVDSSARVGIIGSGIAGASVAFGLASRGVDVTIVDDAMAGQATAASAGIIAPWVSTSTGAYYETYAAGGNFYPAFLEALRTLGIPDLGYRRSGALVVNNDPGTLAEAAATIRSRVAPARTVAGEVHDLDAAELREIFPPIAPDMTGLLITGGGRVDGRVLRDAILTGARLHGARTVADSAQDVTASSAGTWSVRTTSATEDFDALVIAGGARVPSSSDDSATLWGSSLNVVSCSIWSCAESTHRRGRRFTLSTITTSHPSTEAASSQAPPGRTGSASTSAPLPPERSRSSTTRCGSPRASHRLPFSRPASECAPCRRARGTAVRGCGAGRGRTVAGFGIRRRRTHDGPTHRRWCGQTDPRRRSTGDRPPGSVSGALPVIVKGPSCPQPKKWMSTPMPKVMAASMARMNSMAAPRPIALIDSQLEFHAVFPSLRRAYTAR